MSSTIPMTSADQSHDVLEAVGIPHFDATQRRKEKMRQKAAPDSGQASTPSKGVNGNGHAATPPAAATPSPVVSAPAPTVPAPAAPEPAAAQPRLSGVELDEFPTLRHVLNLLENLPHSSQPPAPARAPVAADGDGGPDLIP